MENLGEGTGSLVWVSRSGPVPQLYMLPACLPLLQGGPSLSMSSSHLQAGCCGGEDGSVSGGGLGPKWSSWISPRPNQLTMGRAVLFCY